VIGEVMGVPVALHDRCPNCGCNTAFVGRGPAPLYQQLLCDGCECGRGYVSKELRTFLEKFLQRFGWPDQPIVLRTGKVWRPVQPGDEAATATKPKRKSRKAKRTMKMQELFPSKYLRAADIVGKPRVVTIDHVTHEDFKDDGVTVKKTVIHFKRNGTNTAPMVVNKTNWKMLVAITGSDDDEDWAGHSIQLRSEKVNTKGGKIVDSIRVHEASQSGEPRPKKLKAVPEFNDEIGI
jgi:hypothetical protein